MPTNSSLVRGLLLSMVALSLPAANAQNDDGRIAVNVPPAMRQRVDIKSYNAFLGSIFRSLTNQTGVVINVDRDIPGGFRVDAVSKGDTFWDTLNRLALASHLKVEITGPRSVMVRPLADFWVWYRGRKIGHVREPDPSCRKCDYDRKKEWRFCPMCGDRLN